METIKIGFVVIGDELLSGHTRDANGQILAKTLLKEGLALTQMIFVSDQETEIHRGLQFISNQCDIIITSGGLGPTLDDKTKLSLANYFGQQLKPRENIQDLVQKNYSRFKRDWTPSHNYYHHFPENFFGINNPKGLAPGLGYCNHRSPPLAQQLLLSAPGVPREFEAMLTEEMIPLIKTYFPNITVPRKEVVIRTKGIPEEKIFNELCPNLWSSLSQFGKVSSLPGSSGIDIVITVTSDQGARTQDAPEESIIEHIKSTALFPYVWQFGNLTLPQLVLNHAKEKRVTFGFAESCTGGLLSSKITDLSGASTSFMGSVISYDNTIKEKVLSVPNESLKNFGAVSVEVAEAMAIGALNVLNTDYAISLTGIAGPTGGSVEIAVGTLAVGFSIKIRQTAQFTSGAKKFHFVGDRLRLKERFAEEGLYTLLELLR